MLLGMMFYYVLDDRIMTASDLRQVTDAPFIGYAGAGGRFQKDYEDNLAYLQKQAGGVATLTVTQGKLTGLDAPAWDRLCAAGGVVIVAEYGKVHAVYLAYVIEQLRLRECRLVGIGISGADGRFLHRYYGRAFGRVDEA